MIQIESEFSKKSFFIGPRIGFLLVEFLSVPGPIGTTSEKIWNFFADLKVYQILKSMLMMFDVGTTVFVANVFAYLLYTIVYHVLSLK